MEKVLSAVASHLKQCVVDNMGEYNFVLRKVIFSFLVSCTISVEIVEGYRRRHGSSSSCTGCLQDWEWWEITLLVVGLVLAAAIVWILGQLFCSTECQERCIQ